MIVSDTYKTISTASDVVLLKEKGSKFYGYVFPVSTDDDIKACLDQLRKVHPGAVHHCYAYQIGTDKIRFRANDDGEPANTAGMPIYGQIQSFGVTNVLVVVVRFFGGIKLGVGGLIAAYRTTAQMALENSEIVEKTIDIVFTIEFDYKNINKVMRVIKEKNLRIIAQKMDHNCVIEVATRKKNATLIFDIFTQMFEIKIKQNE